MRMMLNELDFGSYLLKSLPKQLVEDMPQFYKIARLYIDIVVILDETPVFGHEYAKI